MRVADQRLEEIRAWTSGESRQDPAVKPEEWAAIANELRQLRLRTSAASRAVATSADAKRIDLPRPARSDGSAPRLPF